MRDLRGRSLSALRPGRRPRGRGLERDRLRAIAAVTLACWGVLGLYSAQAALPSNIVSLPFEREVARVPLSPQGWHFFTRDPREDHHVVYQENDLRQGLERNLLRPNGAPEHFFGLTRHGRAQLLEGGWVQFALAGHEGFEEEEWTECEDTAPACLDRLPTGPELESPYASPALCGDLVVGRRGARPWAWHARGLTDDPMPQRLAKVTVKC